MFQLTAARRRLGDEFKRQISIKRFQLTAARRRLVGYRAAPLEPLAVSTHSRPKAAGAFLTQNAAHEGVSTHSRPKAAGKICESSLSGNIVSTHSRPKAAGGLDSGFSASVGTFQLTAARRRLVKSSHCNGITSISFNSQPPEGGWLFDGFNTL